MSVCYIVSVYPHCSGLSYLNMYYVTLYYICTNLSYSLCVCDRFSYIMNMQQFIEYRSDKNSKHLSTIRIQSIAASLRQYGLGMIKCFHTKYIIEYQFMHVNVFVFL